MRKTTLLWRLHEDESGQDLLEYALVLVTVLAAIVTGSNSLATIVAGGLGTIIGRIQSTIP